jgi:hypothetical protein
MTKAIDKKILELQLQCMVSAARASIKLIRITKDRKTILRVLGELEKLVAVCDKTDLFK